MDALPGIGRVRLGSLDPSVMTPRFVEIVSALPSLAPHFHLSVQSGCSATLARMHRRYNADQAEAAIARLRAAIPHVQLTTDMIVGFPGETEEEFAASLAVRAAGRFPAYSCFPVLPPGGNACRDYAGAGAGADQTPARGGAVCRVGAKPGCHSGCRPACGAPAVRAVRKP
ncbi:MAG: radical SAM protein [Oscillospiraceae bacterium]|nr:MAG: radical SAM protein [Oscillospiraceae bacterium]